MTKKDAINRIVVLIKSEDQYTWAMNQLIKLVKNAHGDSRDNNELNKIYDRFHELIQERLPQMLEALKEHYDIVYTEQELMDIVEFYDTPSGKAMLEKNPQMTALATEMGNRHTTEIVALLATEFNLE